MTTTLNFTAPLVDLKGTETKQKLNEILADFLAVQTKGNPRKMWIWVQALALGHALTLDNVDKDFLEKLIEDSEHMTTLAKGQLLAIIDEASKATKEA